MAMAVAMARALAMAMVVAMDMARARALAMALARAMARAMAMAMDAEHMQIGESMKYWILTADEFDVYDEGPGSFFSGKVGTVPLKLLREMRTWRRQSFATSAAKSAATVNVKREFVNE
jgi:hypothetical protein